MSISAKITRKTKEVNADVLIIGGGMAACGAAFEARYWGRELRIVMVDKAGTERSGAVAAGLAAANTFMGMKWGENTPEDYVKYCRSDLMGIVREDLVYDIGRHVDSSVHLFEEWGLPFWKDKATGRYYREGRWQVMIDGESYKPIVAEAARKSVDELYEYVMVTHLLTHKEDPNRIAGAVGFSQRDGTFYVFRAKAVIVAAAGATRIFRTRSTAEGHGRSWYPPSASGSSYGLMIPIGAEMTCMENRLVVGRFRDVYNPVGMIFLLLKARATNAYGDTYEQNHLKEQRELYGKYVESKPFPTCLRNDSMYREQLAGKGPIFLHLEEVLSKNEPLKNVQGLEIPGSSKDRLHKLWGYFLGMNPAAAVYSAAANIDYSVQPAELMTTEPYVMGSHATMSGAWSSGPADVLDGQGKDYEWGYDRMTTVKGLFGAGDAIGACPHKFSSGSHAEGRIAAKSAVRYLADDKDHEASPDMDHVLQLKDDVFHPLEVYREGKSLSTKDYISSAYLLPSHALFRLEKIMDEYAGGWSTWYTSNEPLLKIALEKIGVLKEDLKYLAASNSHELMRCWEMHHRAWTAEAVVRHSLYRKETRWPGYFYRADYPQLDDKNWRCFVNSRYDPKTKEWSVFSRPYVQLVAE
ncbi:MAG: adenylyl-sulfate reductase subunit alpha [Nitrososphaerales archaeon]|nr:adenylyl-sulfate reductase subunit alpha [Nitrososphaerales archaeon]